MQHRDAKRLISFSLCLTAILLGSTIYYAARADRYQRYAEYSGQRAAAQLIGSMESMRTVMEALPYTAGTNLFPQTAAQLSQYASAASAALAALHLQDAHLDRTDLYINQAGDLARTLLVQHLAGLPLEQDQLAQLQQVCGGMDDLLEGMREIKDRLNSGELSHGDFGGGDPGLAAAMAELETLAPEQGIRYDGSFSLREPVSSSLLPQLPEAEEQQLAQRAAQLAGRSLPRQSELSAPIPAICFGDETVTVALTVRGGLPLGLLRDEPSGDPVLSAEEAEQAAERFLRQCGYEGLSVSERQIDGDRCRMVWTPSAEGVDYLTDGIVVTVSLVNGDILSLDARDHLLYHSLRQLAPSALSPQEAQSRLPQGLTADDGHLVLLRTPGGSELLCYSFLCETPEGDALRILVRADNGALWDLEPQPDQNVD